MVWGAEMGGRIKTFQCLLEQLSKCSFWKGSDCVFLSQGHEHAVTLQTAWPVAVWPRIGIEASLEHISSLRAFITLSCRVIPKFISLE